ncbi:putative prophage protein [Escherichia coli]|uniref:Putative prophage protein n=1 Tax=Escherichia coli TaxID=562 RepID=A0A376W830_ECOLX|nr:putative prophage protein [Escherichia coli]
MDTIELGNNESLVYGVFPNQDGTFTAMTYTKSKTFKTEKWCPSLAGKKLR